MNISMIQKKKEKKYKKFYLLRGFEPLYLDLYSNSSSATLQKRAVMKFIPNILRLIFLMNIRRKSPIILTF
jgi:hypothetical protein